MKNKLGCTLILSIVSTLPLAVAADDTSKTYFSAGMTYITDKGLDAFKGTGVTIDDSDTVGNFSFGYQLSPSLALEAGIISSGEVSATFSGAETGTFHGKSYTISSTATVKTETNNSYMLGLKYSGASGPFNLNIKVGQLFWDVDYVVTGASGTFILYGEEGYSGASSDTFLAADGSKPYFGIGMSYATSNNSSIDLDYINSEINDADMTGVSLSWVLNF